MGLGQTIPNMLIAHPAGKMLAQHIEHLCIQVGVY
jgi:hypothetical protein